jgi:hypothetical protein
MRSGVDSVLQIQCVVCCKRGEIQSTFNYVPLITNEGHMGVLLHLLIARVRGRVPRDCCLLSPIVWVVPWLGQ